MSETQPQATGPDLAAGIELGQLADGALLLGHVGDQAVMLARQGNEIFAVGANCSHYGGPLAQGLLVGDTIRCPLHHACFSLRTGAALRAPALDPISCWRVERSGDRIQVREKSPQLPNAIRPASADGPKSIVILGGGAAGNSAAETLRREGYAGPITLLSADSSVPCDRPNLSKDYLAGNAAEEWIPLRSEAFYREHNINLHLNAKAIAIHANSREVELEGGNRHSYDTLLLAMGAEPVRLPIAGSDLPHVHYLRSLADSNAIIEASKTARTAIVIGASFIGLEVAASLRTRGLAVRVVAPEAIPMERVLGREIGGLIRALHEEHGVEFHLGNTVASIDATGAALKTGEKLPADLIVVGVGVKPVLALAEKAGLKIDRGVAVDEYLQTSVSGIFAAGDLARWPDPHTGEALRVEHWVVAERQGQTAACNMLGQRAKFDAVPFFWSQHYDVTVHYVGHAEKWDSVKIDGDVAAKDCRVSYFRNGRVVAVATIGRDLESLRAELELEHS